MATVVADRRDARRERRARQHDHRRRLGRRGRADQVHGAVRRARDGRALPVQGQPRAVRLRRPHQARLRVPPDVAAAAPPAGPRGVPGRRLLPALPPAGARRQAQRRPRRRLADGAADHRDAGRRRVRLHPDERHLDHRRADLPRAEAVQLGRAPGHQRRHLGVARRRQRADHADEEGRRQAQARALAVPRARGVRAVRLRPRRRHAGDARPRRAARQDAQPERARAAAGRGPGDPDRSPRPTATSTASTPRRSSDFLDGLTRRAHAEGADVRAKIAGGDWSDETQQAVDALVKRFAEDFGYDLDEEGQPLDRRGRAARCARRTPSRRARTAPPTRRPSRSPRRSSTPWLNETSRTASRRSRTSRRSRARWRWSPRRACAAPSSASPRCGRTRARSGG